MLLRQSPNGACYLRAGCVEWDLHSCKWIYMLVNMYFGFKKFDLATKMNPAASGADAAGSTQACLSPFLDASCVFIEVD